MTWTRGEEGDWLYYIPGSLNPVVLQRVWLGWRGYRGCFCSRPTGSIASVFEQLAGLTRSPRIAAILRTLPHPSHPPEVIVSGRGHKWRAELSQIHDGVPRVRSRAFATSPSGAVARLAIGEPDPTVRVAIEALPGISDWSRWRILTAQVYSNADAFWIAELEGVK